MLRPFPGRTEVRVLIIVLIAVAVVSTAVAILLARRWPATVGAPRMATTSVTTEVVEHRGLRRFLAHRQEPNALTGLALTATVVLVIGLAVLVALLLAMAETNTGLARFDLTLAQYGAEEATTTSTAVLRDVSELGGYPGVVLVATLVGLYELRRTRTPAVVGFLVLVIAGQYLVADTIKLLVSRARPDLNQLTGFAGTSFPSGHAAAAAATYLACALLLGRGRSARTKAILSGVAVGIAVTVATTRIFLGVHWLTDVVAGLLIGWSWFAVCSVIFGGRSLHFGKPVAEATAVAPQIEAMSDR